MTTLEEMDLELRALLDQRRALDRTIREKQDAYNLARAEATGLMGHLVERTVTSYRKPPRTERFIVEGLSRWGGGRSVRGRMVKKDGTVGTREIEANVADLTDLGIYKPEPANA